jgi:hypothetical protein
MAQWPTEHALEIQHLHWYVARGRAFIGKRLRELFAAGEQLSTEELDDICRWMENSKFLPHAFPCSYIDSFRSRPTEHSRALIAPTRSSVLFSQGSL